MQLWELNSVHKGKHAQGLPTELVRALLLVTVPKTLISLVACPPTDLDSSHQDKSVDVRLIFRAHLIAELQQSG